ncbi:MAG: DnaD domain protein [Lachnospiraceae bacterium]|nr:DnaD domain protein [Lachnospiraceae bacterium]MDD3616287.1 DnaD domain protein [Lachnospiraceae bacterium]
MSPIKLKSPYEGNITIISNDFIDHYMPQANGEFVKIYLYLLRNLNKSTSSFLLDAAADSLCCTENDIVRALLYWERVGILKLHHDSENNISSIDFVLLHRSSERIRSTAPAANPIEAPVTIPGEAASPAAPAHSPAVNIASADAVMEPQTAKQPKKTLTASKVSQLKSNPEVKQLLFIAQQYLGKTLSPTEAERILYFYDELDFSFDLIEYLIEYCVTKGKKGIRYIESVAFAWHQDGITTVAMAKEASNLHSGQYYNIMKALGIRNRDPIEPEIKMMDVWLKEYGFTMDIIQEACTRTIQQTNQPSFQYADGILSKWNQSHVHHLADINELDEAHKQASARAKQQKTTQNRPQNGNSFNNFHQRTYDVDALEKQLLNRK